MKITFKMNLPAAETAGYLKGEFVIRHCPESSPLWQRGVRGDFMNSFILKSPFSKGGVRYFHAPL
jgi:hypothetical protein